MKRVAGCVIVLLALTLVLAPSVGTAQQKTTLRLASEHPNTTPNSKSFSYFAEEIAKASGGRIEMPVFFGGQLGTHAQSAEQTKIGSVELAHLNVVHLSGWLPEYSVFGMPFLFRNRPHYFAVLDGEIGKDLFQRLEKVGFKGIYWMDGGSRSTYTKPRPITSPADFTGLKIRVQNDPVQIDAFKALGASPTATAFSEVYSALQTGVIDGAENSATSVRNMGHFEVSKFFSLTEHMRLPDLVVMNLAAFNKLPADLQTVLMDTAKKAEQFQRKAWLEAEDADLKFIEDKGMKINKVEQKPFVDAAKPVYDKYGAKFGDLIERFRNTK
jgi:tripartite ATP-independent transporter DctP family solute receptor